MEGVYIWIITAMLTYGSADITTYERLVITEERRIERMGYDVTKENMSKHSFKYDGLITKIAELKDFLPGKKQAMYNEDLGSKPQPKREVTGIYSPGTYIQESFSPVSVHADTGFDFDKIIYKQTLMPLTSRGETVVFKNTFYGCSTTFSIDPEELKAKGYNKRSSEHINLYNKKEFDQM